MIGNWNPIRRRRPSAGIFYGWKMLTAVSLAQVTSWGILYYAFSVFLTPMSDELGWSIAQMTGAFSLALLISGLAAMPVGRWLDRRGPRGLMTAGSVAAFMLVIAWSRVDSLIGFYLIWAGIGLTMAVVFYEPAFYLVANWFDRRRGRALTLLTFIGGLASVIYIPLASWLVTNYGWRAALLGLAALLLIGTLPIHALLVRKHPRDMGLRPDGDADTPHESTPKRSLRPSLTLSETLHEWSFWWLNAGFVLATFATVAITVHLIPYLTLQGYGTGFAAGAAGLIGLFAMPGRLVFTPLGSWIPRHYVTALIFLLQTASIIVLLEARGSTGVIAFVVLFGAGFGAITPARAALVAELYGPAHYGSINGVLALSTTLARAAAPLGAGALYTGFDSYRPVLWGLVGISALAALAALRTRSSSNSDVLIRNEVTT